ncbi:MAG: glutamine--fructose-6-phosphate transaminase (isomerizing), partial [Bacteroidales bacterium 45-6]
FPHFMLKEIFEQPETLKNCMSGRLNQEGTHVILSGIIDHKKKFLEAKRILIIACGTSWHAGLIGEYLIEEFCRIPVEVEYSSEFRYRNPVIYDTDIVIAISQSGETADTLAAVELARKAGAFVYGVCNVVGSSIPRNTDSGSYTHCGPEIGVASTRAFTAQVMVLTMIALTLANQRGSIKQDEYEDILKELLLIPDKIESILALNEEIKQLASIFTYAHNFIYLGRGFSYPVALEGALKLKEISYIHAEGYPAAEMKHGPIALIDNEMPIVAIASENAIHDKIVSNIQEIKARKGRVIAIITEGDTEIKSMADHCIEIPQTKECLSPLLSCIPLQLLAYHIAVTKNRDVDMPRNLAKSVTVE